MKETQRRPPSTNPLRSNGMTKSAFVCKQNLENCEIAFIRYMKHRYDLDVGRDVKSLRSLLYNNMLQAEATHPGAPVDMLCNLTLMQARKTLVGNNTKNDALKGKIVNSTSSTNLEIVERDKQVFGNRKTLPVNEVDRPRVVNAPRNRPTPDGQLFQTDAELQRMLAERKLLDEPEPPPNPISPPDENVNRNKLTREDFESAMHRIEEDYKNLPKPRQDHKSTPLDRLTSTDDSIAGLAESGMVDTSQTQKNKAIPALTIEHVKMMQDVDPSNRSNTDMYTDTSENGDPQRPDPLPFLSNTSVPTGPPLQIDTQKNRPRVAVNSFPDRIEAIKYICVNGFDRNWTLEPYRYSFTARLVDGPTNFNDITAIQSTSLIIPAEIRHGLRTSQVTPDYVPDKPNFEHSFSFSFPYVILMIDELDDVYEGTNDIVRRSFCHFKYQRHYQAPNGRGYIQLDPMQHEIKRFFPAPLSSLRNLTLSVRKPNGTLFNSSRDDQKLKKIEYEPFQPNLLHIILEKSFDRNEFFVGDTVVLNARLDAKDAKGGTEDSFSTSLEIDALERMQTFLNRQEGHEIIELGATNENDRNNGFYIFAPGTLDQENGDLELDEIALAALVAYNRGIDDNDGKRSVPLGKLLNFSLQCVLCFKVWMSRVDSSSMLVKSNEGGSAFPSMFAESSS